MAPKECQNKKPTSQKAFDFVAQCQLNSYEPLSHVLRRLRAEGLLGEPARQTQTGKLNQGRRTIFMKTHSLIEECVRVGQTSFTDRARPVLTNREVDDFC